MRHTEYKQLNLQFINRWSPRDFSSDAIPEEALMTLFEAARWSPSCYNEQPWLFVYAQKEDELARFQEVLVEGNSWAKSAPVLVYLFAKRTFTFNGNENRWANFDTGSAWMSVALQAQIMGLAAHAMGGYDQEKAYEITGVDKDEYESVCAFVVGKRNTDGELKEEPNDRKDLSDIVFEGSVS